VAHERGDGHMDEDPHANSDTRGIRFDEVSPFQKEGDYGEGGLSFQGTANARCRFDKVVGGLGVNGKTNEIGSESA